MAKDIVIFDVIGKHCGMHYYDEAFANLLKTDNYKVNILSNFDYLGEPAYMPNFFLVGKNRTYISYGVVCSEVVLHGINK